jgi:hypothetical protein
MARELIFCCRHCLTVDTSGVIADSDATIDAIRQYPLVIQCRRCQRYNCVPVSDTMISSSFGPNGFQSVQYSY